VIICLVLQRIITNLLKGRDTMVRLHPVPLDIEIDDLRYFALYLSSKKLISSRILEMRGRDVKQVEWQEWDRLGEETAGRWGEMKKRWAATWGTVLEFCGRERPPSRAVPVGRARLGARGAEARQDAAGGGSLGFGVMMGVRRAASGLIRGGKRRIGWAGLPPRIELVIDVEAKRIRSAVFVVDKALRPDLLEADMPTMLARLLLKVRSSATSALRSPALPADRTEKRRAVRSTWSSPSVSKKAWRSSCSRGPSVPAERCRATARNSSKWPANGILLSPTPRTHRATLRPLPGAPRQHEHGAPKTTVNDNALL